MILKNVIELVGNTPMVELSGLTNEGAAKIYLKLENKNPGGSVKDRAALSMIEEAEKRGELKKGMKIVEPTSGNTGIAIALIGKLKGYEVEIVMPDSMSVERRNIIKAYGAKLILTEGTLGMKGAIDKAKEMAEGNEKYFMPQQFDNHDNSKAHYENTGVEILKDLKTVDYFITGVGTGGTITGVGRKLKEELESVKIIAVEPKKSPVLSGGKSGPHKIQGIGAGFITKIYDQAVVDEVVTVDDEEAYSGVREAFEKEGLFVGISTGANIFAAVKLANTLTSDKVVVTIMPDNGDKYLSVGVF